VPRPRDPHQAPTRGEIERQVTVMSKGWEF